MKTKKNEMARTSTTRGKELAVTVVGMLAGCGWKAAENFAVFGVAMDGKGIIPDVIATVGSRTIYIECKVNGPEVGTLHEKWLYAVDKICLVARQCGAEPVMVIDDQSGKLGPFIDFVVRPAAQRAGVTVYTLNQFVAQCGIKGV